MSRLRTAGVTVALALIWAASAQAKYRGTDVMQNVGPGPAFSGMEDRYPLSAYALDFHVAGPSVSFTGVSTGDIPALIVQTITSIIWSITLFTMGLVTDIFAWAFSLDLLGGAHGALAPVANAVRSIYDQLGGDSWLVAAVVIAGLWGLWRGLVQGRYTETVGGLGVSVVILMLALLCIYQPQQTIGEGSRWANSLSGAFLAAGSGHSPDQPTDAKRGVVTHLRDTLIYKPWAVLEFGGLRHCVNENDRYSDGFPRAVSPHDPRRTTCRDHLHQGADGFGGYAPRFLRYESGSDERDAEYEALRDGKAPNDPQFAGYKVDKADAPAVDIQQAGGAGQRLALVLLIAIGEAGVIALLLMLAFVVILAQVATLALLAFAPVALVVGVIPGRGHALFKWWGSQLLTTLFIKVLYALVLGVLVFVSAALVAAASVLGFLFAFALQAAFFWMVLLYRKRITQALLRSTIGRHEQHVHNLRQRQLLGRAADAAQRPFSALAGVGAAAAAHDFPLVHRKQEPTEDLREEERQPPTAEEQKQAEYKQRPPTEDLRAVDAGQPEPGQPVQPSGLLPGALDPEPQTPVSVDAARDDLDAVGVEDPPELPEGREARMQQLGDLLQRQMDAPPDPPESVVQPGLEPMPGGDR